MIITNPKSYEFLGFEKSRNKYKKYDAILYKNNRYKRVPFGASSYQQYKDTTGLGLYTKLNHNDKERRRLYRLRHAGEQKNLYSSGYFSWYYLW
jgi:hypothetical protein